jgi:tRNA-(ms[2]io[6]A)-hydroxylase
MKAASNALSLAARHPGDLAIVRGLTDLAREEIEHFQRVLSMLEARGVAMGPPPVDAYAAELLRAARDCPCRPAMPAIVDRLLVGALIEARSCERFKLLADETARGRAHADEHALWSDLLAVEARHYRTFVDLATRAAGGAREPVVARLDRLAVLEGAIVGALGRGPAGYSRATIHG